MQVVDMGKFIVLPSLLIFVLVIPKLSEAQDIENTLFPFLEKKCITMLDWQNRPVNGCFNIPPTGRMSEDVVSTINFTLYTRSDPKGKTINKAEELIGTTFNPIKRIKFITHGWLSSGTSDTCINIKDGYLKLYDANVIVMNWQEAAGDHTYFTSMWKVPRIADLYAEFINDLIQKLKVHGKYIHLIGHSLGAQVSGLVWKRLNGSQIGRVTGLDPASIGFGFFSHRYLHKERISKNSAEFVDIIHSCAGFSGLLEPVGHVDFYPNGGVMPQPGCGIDFSSIQCSHDRAWQYFAESLAPPNESYYAVPCGLRNIIDAKCKDGDKIVMGELTPHTARGTFYLRTEEKPPYSLGKNFLYGEHK